MYVAHAITVANYSLHITHTLYVPHCLLYVCFSCSICGSLIITHAVYVAHCTLYVNMLMLKMLLVAHYLLIMLNTWLIVCCLCSISGSLLIVCCSCSVCCSLVLIVRCSSFICIILSLTCLFSMLLIIHDLLPCTFVTCYSCSLQILMVYCTYIIMCVVYCYSLLITLFAQCALHVHTIGMLTAHCSLLIYCSCCYYNMLFIYVHTYVIPHITIIYTQDTYYFH